MRVVVAGSVWPPHRPFCPQTIIVSSIDTITEKTRAVYVQLMYTTSGERRSRVRLGRTKRKTPRESWHPSLRRGRRALRKSHPFGIPNGRRRTTMGCRRRDPHRSDIEHRFCSPGRGDSSNHRLGRGQRDCGSISQAVGAAINMAKARIKQVVIPKFSSEAEEAAWWDAHRSAIESEIRQRIRQKRPLTLDNLLRRAKPSQTGNAEDSKRRPRDSSPVGGPKRFGISDLHKNVAPRSACGRCVGKNYR